MWGRNLCVLGLLTGTFACTEPQTNHSEVVSRYVLDRSWGGSGVEPGKFREPMGIAIDTDGHVYVADVRNRRVQKFTLTERTWRPSDPPAQGQASSRSRSM